MKIEKILVANRGEIALRAIRTIKEMGKQAIAVYSTADKDALYLQHADASICIGGAKSSESYLSIPAIISAAEISGCDAIFPGYGFLSENQTFVEVCKHHNIKFIGPSVDSMVLMSDKSKAKDVMKKAGVPVELKVVAIFKAICPALPIPLMISFPPRSCTCFTISDTASSYPGVTGMLRTASASCSNKEVIFSFTILLIDCFTAFLPE